MGHAKLTPPRQPPDLDRHASGDLRAMLQGEGETQALRPDDLEVLPCVRDVHAVLSVHEAKGTADPRIERDARHRTQRGREQPLACDRRIEPGIENALPGSLEAPGDADDPVPRPANEAPRRAAEGGCEIRQCIQFHVMSSSRCRGSLRNPPRQHRYGHARELALVQEPGATAFSISSVRASSATGRTSTQPIHAPGIRAATLIASLRSRASIRK